MRKRFILKVTCALLAVSTGGLPAAQAQEKARLQTTIDATYHLAGRQLLRLHGSVGDDVLPRTINKDGTLRTSHPDWWTSGFFPGCLWLAFEKEGIAELKQAALQRTAIIEAQQYNDKDHDIGFKILCSYGNKWRITGDSAAARIIVTAAQTLSKRFNPSVGAIRSWGNSNDTTDYIVIIDNMMNLELLFTATRLSGDSSFYKIAVAHADKTLANHFRPDGSSYHVVHYDNHTGAVTRKRTQQGYADESAWARGQAWGLYGYVVCYRETKQEKYLAQANKIAQFLLQHPRLPEDKIPYWDFDTPGIPGALRDVSAAAITSSALIELSRYVPEEKASFYFKSAEKMLISLCNEPYRTKMDESHNFLLKHSVGSLPVNSEVDVPLSYADYYFLEAMGRWKAYISR